MKITLVAVFMLVTVQKFDCAEWFDSAFTANVFILNYKKNRDHPSVEMLFF